MPTPALPTEIWERTIDIVEAMESKTGYRERTLYACALVSRTWLPRSRVHLFETLTLSSDRKTEKFIKALLFTPLLGQRVQTLRIFPRMSWDDPHKHQSWIYKALQTLPTYLTNLRVLVFRDLPTLHPLALAFLPRFTTVQSLRLVHLTAQSFGDIVRFATRFPKVTELWIQDCEWKSPGHYYRGKSLPLDILVVEGSKGTTTDILEWISASKSCLVLRVLYVGSIFTPESAQGLEDIQYRNLQELSFGDYELDGELPPSRRIMYHRLILNNHP